MLSAVQQCDPAAEAETVGLIPGTALRPADVLTSALGNGFTALDIGITSPDAQLAGDDCTAAMFERKKAYYEPYERILAAQSIAYCPLVWSAYGGPHAQAKAALKTIAARIARRRALAHPDEVYAHMTAGISTEIWRRAAKALEGCWPSRPDEWMWQTE